MEKLQINHLAAYLPYGLYIENLNYKCDYVGIRHSKINSLYSIHTHDGDMWHYKTNAGNVSSINDGKPILRPLSDLIKEINHNGESFIPMQKLLDQIGVSDPDTFEKGDGYVVCHYTYDSWAFGFKYLTGFYFNNGSSGWDREYNLPQMLLFQTLFEWKFDVFNLIPQNLAIDVNSLSENVYK